MDKLLKFAKTERFYGNDNYALLRTYEHVFPVPADCFVFLSYTKSRKDINHLDGIYNCPDWCKDCPLLAKNHLNSLAFSCDGSKIIKPTKIETEEEYMDRPGGFSKWQ